ncbi:PDT-domain-containing protein [Stemphylium lycopersici]|nr:chorismate mutase prephenate dehydratase [Stemphylium lycopersici]RAQ99816.1 PDT-domain-containing protein [Stemphylium lycopersici]
MAEGEERIVAYLGPEGSYTHQAAQTAFPPPTTSATLRPVPTIEHVFSAVQTGAAHRGVVPFENSSNGSVVFTLDLFADLQAKYPGILAWGQCKTFLSSHLAHAERHDASSTSRAAEIAAADKTGRTAALSSPIAADLFGLHVLARSVNDVVGNTTRFLVIRRTDEPTTTAAEAAVADAAEAHEDRFKSLVTFTVEHSNPGALAACLTVFSRNGINLTSINTRPSGVERWNYIFFVEFKGRRRQDDGGGVVNKALRELEGVCKRCRWLGSWENRLLE